jgi:hypothetical protein
MIEMEDREFELRERDLQLREREVVLKERESKHSKWATPLFLTLLTASIGFVASVLVTYANNRAAERTEQVRAQSTLILEAIKGSDKDATCKNLIFFVNLGLLDDTKNTIRGICPSTENGVPSLPAIGSSANIVPGSWLWTQTHIYPFTRLRSKFALDSLAPRCPA